MHIIRIPDTDDRNARDINMANINHIEFWTGEHDVIINAEITFVNGEVLNLYAEQANHLYDKYGSDGREADDDG